MRIENLGQYLTDEEVIYTHLYGNNTVYIEGKIVRLNSTLNKTYTNYIAVDNNLYSLDTISIMAIFAMLEQIGLCYNIENIACNYLESFKRALQLFGNKDKETINTLYALRNSLLHNISFSAEDPIRPKSKKYYFKVNNKLPLLYKKSNIEWNGDYNLLKQSNVDDYVTFINLNKLKELFEKCLDSAKTYALHNKLNIRLANGREQLCINYITIEY